MINNVVLVSGIQQSDSVMHIYISDHFQILFPLGCYVYSAVFPMLCSSPCWLSILDIAVCNNYCREMKTGCGQGT